VQLEDQDGGAKVRYQLVGDDEADIKQGLLSVSSPIARALIGKSRATWSTSRRPAAPAPTKSSSSSTCEHAAQRLPGGPGALGGSLWSLAVWVAPTLFYAQSDRRLAGLLAGRLFSIESYLGAGVAAAALIHPARRANSAGCTWRRRCSRSMSGACGV
jgi:hypothetical protein